MTGLRARCDVIGALQQHKLHRAFVCLAVAETFCRYVFVKDVPQIFFVEAPGWISLTAPEVRSAHAPYGSQTRRNTIDRPMQASLNLLHTKANVHILQLQRT